MKILLKDTGRHCWLATPNSPVPKLLTRQAVDAMHLNNPSLAQWTLVATSTPRAYKIARLRWADRNRPTVVAATPRQSSCT